MKAQPDPIVSTMYLRCVLEFVATKWMPAFSVTSVYRTWGDVDSTWDGRRPDPEADRIPPIDLQPARSSSVTRAPNLHSARVFRRKRKPDRPEERAIVLARSLSFVGMRFCYSSGGFQGLRKQALRILVG